MAKIIKPLDDGKRRILSLDEAMAQIDAHQPPKPQPPQDRKPVGGGTPAGNQLEARLRTYLGLEWELAVCIGYSDIPKHLFTYDESLTRLQKAGYTRHPSPQEVLSLITAYHEKKLNLVLGSLATDILVDASEGIFSCHVGEIEGHWLHIYEYADFLKWDQENKHYKTPPGKIWFQGRKSFDIIGLDSNERTALDIVNANNPELVEYFYGRKFEDLPDAMKPASIFIPWFESFPHRWPIICEGKNVTMGIHPPQLTHEKASLGVR